MVSRPGNGRWYGTAMRDRTASHSV